MREALPNIWPLGSGVVAIASATTTKQWFLLFRAVPDANVRTPGDSATIEEWTALAAGPTMTLSFEDVPAIDRLIAQLERLRDEPLALANQTEPSL